MIRQNIRTSKIKYHVYHTLFILDCNKYKQNNTLTLKYRKVYHPCVSWSIQ